MSSKIFKASLYLDELIRESTLLNSLYNFALNEDFSASSFERSVSCFAIFKSFYKLVFFSSEFFEISVYFFHFPFMPFHEKHR